MSNAVSKQGIPITSLKVLSRLTTTLGAHLPNYYDYENISQRLKSRRH